jgi:hypothetical protein
LVDVDSSAYTGTNGFTWKVYIPKVYAIITSVASTTTANTRYQAAAGVTPTTTLS